MKTLITIFFFQFIFNSLAYANTGHRLGGDLYEPENTLYSFKRVLKKDQFKPDFQYAELDIQESRDGIPIVFHDIDRINRIVPKSAINLIILKRALKFKRFEKIRISDLYEKEITALVLKHKSKIPTLKTVLDAAILWNLKKPILIEVKSLRSDKCRLAVINLVSKYKSHLKLNFLSFKKNYNISFPDKLRWSYQFKKHGFKVFTTYKPKTSVYDMTQGYNQNANTWKFINILNRPIHIKNSSTRTIEIPFNFNKNPRTLYGIRVGILHGADDTGDKGLSFKLESDSKYHYLSGFSKERGWKWYQTIGIYSQNLVLTIKDVDTKFGGKNSGNKAKIKINLIEL